MKALTDDEVKVLVKQFDEIEQGRYKDGRGDLELAMMIAACDRGQPPLLAIIPPDHERVSIIVGITKMMYDAVGLISEGYMTTADRLPSGPVKDVPGRLEVFMIQFFREGHQPTMFSREIITDKHGKRSLGDVVCDSFSVPGMKLISRHDGDGEVR